MSIRCGLEPHPTASPATLDTDNYQIIATSCLDHDLPPKVCASQARSHDLDLTPEPEPGNFGDDCCDDVDDTDDDNDDGGDGMVSKPFSHLAKLISAGPSDSFPVLSLIWLVSRLGVVNVVI